MDHRFSLVLLSLAGLLASSNAQCLDLETVAALNLAPGTTNACDVTGGDGDDIAALGDGLSCGITCAAGFTVSGGNAQGQGTVECTNSAFVSQSAMTVNITCAPAQCAGVPTGAQTGFDYSSCVEVGTDVTGSTCTPVCAAGYTNVGTSSGFVMTCDASTGVFSTGGNDANLQCNANDCTGSPTSGAQTGFDYSSCSGQAGVTTSGTTCTPVCATGYSAGAGAAGTATGQTLTCAADGSYTVVADATLTCTPNVCSDAVPASAEAGVDYSSCVGQATGASCTPVCSSTHTGAGTATPFVLSCASDGSWTAGAISPMTCTENQCTAGSGTRTGYDCVQGTGAAGSSTCGNAGGAAMDTAVTVSQLGTITCTDGYGTGPLALAAGNGAAATCVDGGNFVFTGCHASTCDDATGLGTAAFLEDDDGNGGLFCGTGTKIISPLPSAATGTFCETTTCQPSDCCENINECVEYDDPGTDSNVDPSSSAGSVLLSGCAANTQCIDADPNNNTMNGIQGTTIELNGDTAGTISSTHTCTCLDGWFGDGDAAGTGCTQCTEVANSASVTCTTAANSQAVCVTGAILVQSTSPSTADVCRLECPFVDLVAMIDVLQPSSTTTCPTLGSGDDIETSKNTCEAVAGCYYKPVDGVTAHSCAELYTDCQALSADAATCTTNGPRVWGTSLTVASDDGTDDSNGGGTDGTDGTLTTSGCAFTAANAGGDSWDDNDRCDIAPASIVAGATTWEEVRQPVVRCEALLATGWAHDLRGSCDATLACKLHDTASGAGDGLVARVKEVYSDPAAQPPNLANEHNDNGAPSNNVGGFFTTNAANDMTTFEICSEIRDAVNAAPTCSSSSG